MVEKQQIENQPWEKNKKRPRKEKKAMELAKEWSGENQHIGWKEANSEKLEGKFRKLLKT